MKHFVAAVAILVCSGCGERSFSKPKIYQTTIQGSSMEPSLHGERTAFTCGACKRSGWFVNEPEAAYATADCPWCGQSLDQDRLHSRNALIPAETVGVERLDGNATLRRFDKVVIVDNETKRLEVKRLIGFPNESVHFIDGDLWIDGERMSKSLPQFLDQAVVVDRWNEAVGELKAPHSAVYFRSTSLWPRTGESLATHPSPILDDYKMLRSESRWLVPVRDVGLRLELDLPSCASSELEIGILVDNAWLSVSIEMDGRGWRPKESQSFFESEILIAAYVDHRLLVGTESDGLPIKPFRAAAGDVSPATPVSVRLVSGGLRIKSAHILRDICYRGADGQSELALPGVIGYHLIGDNTAVSFDSRRRWPNGVARENIVGRVLGHRSIGDDCKRLSPASPPTSTSQPAP